LITKGLGVVLQPEGAGEADVDLEEEVLADDGVDFESMSVGNE
jgi:hypothetical protein